MDLGDINLENRRTGASNKKKDAVSVFFLVAGLGFEPRTFGL
jgi:hypothetical protein